MHRKKFFIIIVSMFLWSPHTLTATLRVAAYNTGNHPNNATEDVHFDTIFAAIGNEEINGVAKRLDLLIVSETDGNSRDRLPQILNDLYSVSDYNVETSSST